MMFVIFKKKKREESSWLNKHLNNDKTKDFKLMWFFTKPNNMYPRYYDADK